LPDATPPIPSVTPETPAAPAGPSNLRLRVIWGVIGAVLLLGSVWFSPWTFGLFFAAVQAIMLWEFYRMMRAGGYAPAAWIGVAVGSLSFLILFYYLDLSHYINDEAIASLSRAGEESPQYISSEGFAKVSRAVFKVGLSLLIGLPIILILREMREWPKYKNPFLNVGCTLLGLFYVFIPMTLLNVIAYDKSVYDYRRVFALLFLIWASDIGAYAVGRAIGKHKLAPQISPGKTWEGWAGGFVLTLVVGWAIGYMLPDMPLTHRLVAAGVVAVFAPLGDLAESMLKRSVGVKDSGSIMPGHGGLLDRFDAFLLVLPVLALLQLLAG
jgi:phosphatidate cytidylyltransferase